MGSGAEGFLTIHGHFYQPPRENPWIEEIELEESAAPYHDWNERIVKECYGPNSCSRIVDGQNSILDVVNNYGLMSYNFGPTIIGWLERRYHFGREAEAMWLPGAPSMARSWRPWPGTR